MLGQVYILELFFLYGYFRWMHTLKTIMTELDLDSDVSVFCLCSSCPSLQSFSLSLSSLDVVRTKTDKSIEIYYTGPAITSITTISLRQQYSLWLDCNLAFGNICQSNHDSSQQRESRYSISQNTYIHYKIFERWLKLSKSKLNEIVLKSCILFDWIRGHLCSLL